MKARLQKQRSRAMTLVDTVVAVILIVAVLLFIFVFDWARGAQDRARRIRCVNNLKQVDLAFRVWDDKSPVSHSTNSAPLEWPVTTNLAVYFQVLSNAPIGPSILACPADNDHNTAATNWTTDFNDSHISYFFNLDAGEDYPQELVSGDDNFALNGVPVKSGLLLLSSNAPISWTAARHKFGGNIGFADGSVAGESNSGLQRALQLSVQGTPVTTNRIVIP